MIRRISKSLALSAAVVALTVASGAVQAGPKCDPNNLVKSGTFEASVESVGFIASVHWGKGTVTLKNGETHKFDIMGGKLIETGFGETHIEGTVYNLEKIEDFEGVYYGSSSESALIKGPKGGIIAKNSSNCVYLHGDSATKGVRLSPPAPGGVKIKLAD
jgi:hypothetical protein